MKTPLFPFGAILLLIGAAPAHAGDSAIDAFLFPAQHDWNGFYAGVAAGAAWGSYDERTAAVSGPYLSAIDAAAVYAAGVQNIKPTGFATGIEGGYNWQAGYLLLGIEADVQALHLNGATNTGAVAYPGTRAGSFTVTSYANADWLFTARPRIGIVAPNHWLFYATGGLALTQPRNDFLLHR